MAQDCQIHVLYPFDSFIGTGKEVLVCIGQHFRLQDTRSYSQYFWTLKLHAIKPNNISLCLCLLSRSGETFQHVKVFIPYFNSICTPSIGIWASILHDKSMELSHSKPQKTKGGLVVKSDLCKTSCLVPQSIAITGAKHSCVQLICLPCYKDTVTQRVFCSYNCIWALKDLQRSAKTHTKVLLGQISQDLQHITCLCFVGPSWRVGRHGSPGRRGLGCRLHLGNRKLLCRWRCPRHDKEHLLPQYVCASSSESSEEGNHTPHRWGASGALERAYVRWGSPR